jgi:ADP-heptose:LPS heptosyltransferase
VAALAGAEGPGSLDALVPELAVTAADLGESRDARPGDEPFVAMHVGALDARRRWPVQHFVELATLLQRDGLAVVLVGSADDHELSRQVAAARPDWSDLSGQLSLGGTLGLLSRASAFVGNDSGPRHLAVAAGAATVGVFWIPHVLTFGPLSGSRHRAAVAYRTDCPECGAPQIDRRCGHTASLVQEVEPSAVHAQVRELLADDAVDRRAG